MLIILLQAVGDVAERPGTGSALATFMEQDVKLLDEPVVADGKVTLTFNESIYNSADGEEKTVSADLLHSLVLSLTEQEGIESVAITGNGEQDLVNEEGKSLTEPVSRP
ncbi:GerMN domain-containing protein [Niallia taxi]|nr:GerMN domain-containing protein [Niallia taxi]MDE5052281.1 GerMN domain-containing protein [Niallia taxi]